MGALIMAALLNGMTLLAVSPETKYIARRPLCWASPSGRMWMSRR